MKKHKMNCFRKENGCNLEYARRVNIELLKVLMASFSNELQEFTIRSTKICFLNFIRNSISWG